MYICAREVWWGNLPLERLRVFSPQLLSRGRFCQKYRKRLLARWANKDWMGKNWQSFFCDGANNGVKIQNIVWPLGWASSSSLTVWLVSADKDGGMGVGGGLNWPLLPPPIFPTLTNLIPVWFDAGRLEAKDKNNVVEMLCGLLNYRWYMSSAQHWSHNQPKTCTLTCFIILCVVQNLT